MDRRGFLALASGAVAGITTLSGRSRAGEGDPFGGFTVGVQSYTFRQFTLDRALGQIKALGLSAVELSLAHAPLNDDPAKANALSRLCQDHGVTPRVWGVQKFTKDTDANRKSFEFGKLLGLRVMSANPDPDAFANLDKLCEEYKIAIAIHPHGPTGSGKLDRWYSAELIHAAVKDHHPLIGACLDTGHLIRCAQLGKHLDPAEQIRVMGKRNFGLHLKDHDNTAKSDVPFGRGVLDVTAVLKALREVGFKGMISIEYEAHPEEPTADVRACLATLKESVKKLT
jgi:sugar phosphate isomerase/epimerase